MDSYQLKWHSHSNHLNGSVAALLRSERFTDVVLCTLDGCQIPAHKFILNSCSIYLSNLFESQRSAFRLGNSMIYVILPAEITTKALQILIEYMYRGETTVSNDVLDIVLKAGDLLKVRGLWRQSEDKNEKPADKIASEKTTEVVLDAKQTGLQTLKKVEEPPKPKITVKKDDKLLQAYTPLQHINISRQSFINPPKLVFIKKSDANAPAIRSLAPKTIPQTIIVKPDLPMLLQQEEPKEAPIPTTNAEPKSMIRKTDKKYGKKLKTDHKSKTQKVRVENDSVQEAAPDITDTFKEELIEKNLCDVISIKPEPNWENDNSMDQESIFHTEITIKPELDDEMGEEMDDGEQIYSPLTCELCFEVFHIPAEWVRHIQTHAESNPQARKRKTRSASDDTEEATALLRCDLCQKLFPNPAEWVRHIQNTHTETELAMSNNSSPPRRHNRYVYGDQKKTCDHCKKVFPSHASMIIHQRTHTGERPFVCGLCNKGFNVKSNLLRHLRTLHDTIVSPGNVPLLQDNVLLSQSSNAILPSTPLDRKDIEAS